MSSNTAGGGTFTNVSSSAPQTSKPNSQTNPSTTNSMTTSSNEIALPTYNTSDPRSILKALIRFIMRTFYEVPKSLIIEYIYHYERIKQEDLAQRLCLDPKIVRSYIQEFKRDKFIIEDHRLESNDGTTGRRNQDQYYYKIDTDMFINVVKYRLHHMRNYVEKLEREQTYKQSNYKCEQCSKEYTELDILKLYDLTQDALVCIICGGIVHEDVEMKETTDTTNRQTATMSLFNEQMKPLYEILAKIDDIMNNVLQLKNTSDPDFFQQNGNASSSSTSNNPANKDATASAAHRSHASNVFDRTTTLNHEIQIIIEKDDDDYSQMDTDETSNTDVIIPPPSAAISSSAGPGISTIANAAASRGPGKPGKKSTKSTTQSAAEAASQPVTIKMKLSNKKVPYEPKPLPQWFVRSTVYHGDNDDEQHRHHNSSAHHSTSTISRQLSNQKLTKSTTISDIKQMLLIHESKRNKKSLTSLTTMEDSLSPPTPTSIQITKTTDSQ